MIIEEGALPGPLAGLLPAPLAATADLVGQDTDEGFLDKLREKIRALVSIVGGPYHGAMPVTSWPGAGTIPVSGPVRTRTGDRPPQATRTAASRRRAARLKR